MSQIMRCRLRRNRRYCLILCAVFGILIYLFHEVLHKTFSLSSSGYRKEFSAKEKLTYRSRKLYLNGEEFIILSGAIHYFRVVPEYWEDRLRKLKVAGLNTVETYCPWNWHEEVRGMFNFEGILNIRHFIKIAGKLGLYVIVRPGPYIGAEWEYGGLPSWLLRDPNMKVRSMYYGFTKAVDEYFSQLLREIQDLQFTKGGPIIAFQIESEYGTYGTNEMYMNYLKTMMIEKGVVEAMFQTSSDVGIQNLKPVPGIFVGVNFHYPNNGHQLLEYVESLDDDYPKFVGELWTGWFCTWESQPTYRIAPTAFYDLLSDVVKHQYNFNLYMFHGGTNFGFMNGALSSDNHVVTSYDYDALVTESGQLSQKYFILRRAISHFLSADQVAKIPDVPNVNPAATYGHVIISEYLPWNAILDLIESPISSAHPLLMEELPINAGSGQSYGFILYRAEFAHAQRITVKGFVRDRTLVLIDSAPLNATNMNFSIILPSENSHHFDLIDVEAMKDEKEHVLDILVENQGRIHTAAFQDDQFNQMRKGLHGTVFLDREPINSWSIYPLEFKKPFINKASASTKWLHFSDQSDRFDAATVAPALYRGHFVVNERPHDTFIHLEEAWAKGVVFINGFNLGRYWQIKPGTLYLPGPLLRKGNNELIIFELHSPGPYVQLISQPAVHSETEVPPTGRARRTSWR